jgi:predicted metal-dependent hydrolase
MPDLKSFMASAPGGWGLEIAYKPIRHIYFRVYPEKKKVKVSAPVGISSSRLSSAIHAKSGWLLRKMNSPRHKIHLENKSICHFKGQAYPLVHLERPGAPKVLFDPEKGIIVQTRPGATPEKKADVLSQWMRQRLKQEIALLLDQWEPVMGVKARQFRVRKMKTRWGSCNTRARRIWINLALIRLSPEFLEYVLVHELAHLLEPSHNRRFYRVMDQFLPQWKKYKTGLDQYAPETCFF